jgi:transcription termination factor NusB
MHKTEAEGVLVDLCMEIENTLINIEDIDTEIEGLKQSANVDLDDLEDSIVINMKDEDDEDEGFLERMADTVEDALEGLDEAIEAALDKLELADEVPAVEDDEIEVVVEEYLDDDDFVAPEEDGDVEVEIIEIEE